MKAKKGKPSTGFSRRELIAAPVAAVVAMPAILRHTRAYAQEPVFKVGYCSPISGGMAYAGEPDPFVLREVKAIIAGGVENNGRRVKVEILDRDTATNRARTTASELVEQDHVDMIAATGLPITTGPVAEVAELNGVPCLTSQQPMAAILLRSRRRPGGRV